MRFKILSDAIARILILFSMSFMIPIITSIVYREPIVATILWFAVPMLLCAGTGALLWFLSRHTYETIRDREAFAAVAFGWLLIAFFGSLPFLLSGAITEPAGAYFESMSGFSTTGATVLTGTPTADGYFPYAHSIIMWRSQIQWFGGMGIIVLSVVIFARVMEGGFELMKAEVPGVEVTRIKPKIAKTAALLWRIYLIFTIAEVVLLLAAGLNLFDSINTAFTTLATGGFSPKAISIEGFNNVWVEIIVIVFMFIAGTNFVLHYHVLTGRVRPLLRDPEFRFYVLIIAFATVLIMGNLFMESVYSLANSVRHATFQVISLQTTTGYSTANFGEWPFMSQFILLVLMFVGGCAGSTGGSIKVVRILVLLKAGRREVRKVIHPNAVIPVRIGDRTLSNRVVRTVGIFFFIYMIIFVLATILVIPAMGEMGDITTASTAVAATLGNIGPGLNHVGPYMNFAFISPYGKLLLAFCMWFGRLEILTGLLVFFPSSYWR